MYDNIKMRLISYTPKQTAYIKNRFSLFETSDKNKPYYHNRGNETLTQNHNIYIKIEEGVMYIELSLQKFYNSITTGKQINYNDFSFKQANKAYIKLKELLKLNISKANVLIYEYGINVLMSKEPEAYMKQIKGFEINKQYKKVIEDRRYKEYKLYGTNQSKNKRTIYIMYNKTYETYSKIKNIDSEPETIALIPKTLLRIETKIKRPSRTIELRELFITNFQKQIKQSFLLNFTQNIEFKQIHIKTKEMTSNNEQLYRQIRENGVNETLKDIEQQFKNNAISKRTYNRRIDYIKLLNNNNLLPLYKQTLEETEFKQLIINKLNKI